MTKLVRVMAAGVLAVLLLLAGGPARADTPSLGGYNVTGDGNVVDILIDNTTGLAGVHPLSEADFPEAESTFETGPFGSGLATVFWPGGPAADFGSLAPEVGFPPSSEPLYSQLYDPIRADAQYPSGPSSSTYPANGPSNGFEMQSKADSTGVTSTAAMTDQPSTAAILSFSQAKGTSSATANTVATGTSSSDLTDVKLLGGLVDIGSITSTAKASSDGTKPATGSAATRVSGVTVLGLPASIGSDGLTLPNFAKALGPITGPIVDKAMKEAVSGLGLTVTEFPSTTRANGESYAATSGGVAIKIVPPASAATLLEQAGQALAPFFPSQAGIIPTLPGILQGFTMTITLGRATATTNASPPFNLAFNPPPIAGASGSAPSSGSGSSPVAGAVPPPSGGASLAPTGPSAVSSSSPGSAAQANIGSATPIGLSSPLGAGAVVAGIAVAAIAGFGLWRLARTLLPQDVEPVCPLGQDNA
jgi:hypothetical protein